ncbi:MAG: hypothetical protein ACHQC9_03130 [Alphaproteobacteria bacterium]
MTLAEAGEIFTCWEENPPAHLMLQTIARMLGWTPRSIPAGAPPIEDIAAAAPPGLAVARGGNLGMPAPADLDALRAKNRAQALAIARRGRSAAVG